MVRLPQQGCSHNRHMSGGVGRAGASLVVVVLAMQAACRPHTRPHIPIWGCRARHRPEPADPAAPAPLIRRVAGRARPDSTCGRKRLMAAAIWDASGRPDSRGGCVRGGGGGVVVGGARDYPCCYPHLCSPQHWATTSLPHPISSRSTCLLANKSNHSWTLQLVTTTGGNHSWSITTGDHGPPGDGGGRTCQTSSPWERHHTEHRPCP
jgi:hypothetical protein